MSNILFEIIGYLGAFLISVAFLPQTIKLIKNKNTKGLSLICASLYQLGLILFIINASLTPNYPLLAANVFGAIVNTILLSLIVYNLYYKKTNNTIEKEQHHD